LPNRESHEHEARLSVLASPFTRAVTIGSADALSAAPVRGAVNRPCSARAHDAAVASGNPHVRAESGR
jgi:hypothetical protein